MVLVVGSKPYLDLLNNRYASNRYGLSLNQIDYGKRRNQDVKFAGGASYEGYMGSIYGAAPNKGNDPPASVNSLREDWFRSSYRTSRLGGSSMIGYVLPAIVAALIGYMLGQAFRMEADRMRIRHLLDEVHSQLLTIIRHEETIKTLTYVANQRKSK